MFRRKYVKPQSMVTAKHKFPRLVFNPANWKIIEFLYELQKLAKDAFRVAAQEIIEQFFYAKIPPHVKKFINQSHLENGTYEQFVSHLEKELELNVLEASDEMQINTVAQQASQQNSEKSKPTGHHCKKPGHYRNQCRQLKREKDPIRNNTNFAENTKKTMVVLKRILTLTIKFQTIPMQTVELFKETEDLDLSSHPLRHVVEPTTPQRNVTLEQTQLTDRLPGLDDRKNKANPNRKCSKQLRWECPSCSPNFELYTPRFYSGAPSERPEANETPILPPIPEVVWQQPTETITDQDKMYNTNNDSTSKTVVASRTSPPKVTQPQNYVVITEHLPENQTGNEPVPFLNNSKNCPTGMQNSEQHVKTTFKGHTTTPRLTTATPLIEEALVRDEQTNAVYLQITSTVVLERTQEWLNVPPDF